MSKFETSGMTTPDDAPDVTVDITVEGDEDAAQTVLLHSKDQIVRAMQAVSEGKPPEDCDGAMVSVDWERKLEMMANE